MKVGIAFLSRDRTQQSRQAIEPLLRSAEIDLWWVDGSITREGKRFPDNYQFRWYKAGVYGGADAAIVCALTSMLTAGYRYIGITEQDVLLHPGWFESCMALFKRGEAEGLKVGAVSARSYADRILIQRDGYAVMHNLGSGMVIYTRDAAEIILANYRNGHTWENRAIFAQLSGLDIGRYWAFSTNYQHLTVDWGFDATLARHGLASLALVPNAATMLEDIAPMGLAYADEPYELLRDDERFARFAANTKAIRDGKQLWGYDPWFRDIFSGDTTIFAHQLLACGARYEGKWTLRWAQGFGPFCWRAAEVGASVTVPIFGECHMVISGGQTHARVRAEAPGLELETTIEAERPGRESVRLSLSGDFLCREAKLTALTAGLCFYGMQTRAPQQRDPNWKFDWSMLPPAGVGH